MSTPLTLGTFGAWFNPAYDDVTRTRFVAEAEAVGYTAAWLGMGRGAVADLDLVERALDATSTIVVVTAIVNMWTNDAASIARSYHPHLCQAWRTLPSGCWDRSSGIDC